MKIKELTFLEFDEFAKNHSLGSYHQSSLYALLMSNQGYEYDEKLMHTLPVEWISTEVKEIQGINFNPVKLGVWIKGIQKPKQQKIKIKRRIVVFIRSEL